MIEINQIIEENNEVMMSQWYESYEWYDRSLKFPSVLGISAPVWDIMAPNINFEKMMGNFLLKKLIIGKKR